MRKEQLAMEVLANTSAKSNQTMQSHLDSEQPHDLNDQSMTSE